MTKTMFTSTRKEFELKIKLAISEAESFHHRQHIRLLKATIKIIEGKLRDEG